MIKSLLYLITMLSVFFMPEAFCAGGLDAGWGDVAMSVLYCAIAGGAILLGSYAWTIWG